MKRHRVALAVLFLAFVATPRGAAGSVEQLGFLDLVRNSSLIIEGVVVSVELDSEVTQYEVCSVRTLMGAYDAECLSIDSAGGKVVSIDGMPELVAEDHVVLFLTSHSPYHCPFTGWTQGVLKVKEIEGVSYLYSSDGRPISAVSQTLGILAAETRLTWAIAHAEAVEKAPFEIVAEKPVSLGELSAMIEEARRALGIIEEPHLSEDWKPREL